MANVTKVLPSASLRQEFSNVASDWVGANILDPLKVDSLVGFKVLGNEVPSDEGDVTITPYSNDAQANTLSVIPSYTPVDISFTGYYTDQATFESSNTLENGIAYHDETEDKGYVYYNGTYYEIDYSTMQFGATYAGSFSIGVFPETNVKWKDIIDGEIGEKQGWPPPLDDVMSQFLFSVKMDTTPSKTKSVIIEYYVKTVTETPGDPNAVPPTESTFESTYSTDTYTYNKTINNNLPDIISLELETFFDQFPEISTVTGEIIE